MAFKFYKITIFFTWAKFCIQVKELQTFEPVEEGGGVNIRNDQAFRNFKILNIKITKDWLRVKISSSKILEWLIYQIWKLTKVQM